MFSIWVTRVCSAYRQQLRKASRRRWQKRTKVTLGLQELEDRAAPSADSAVVELFETAPAVFVENQGQWEDESVRYAFSGSGGNVLHTDRGPVFHLFQQQTNEQDQLPRDPLAAPDPWSEPDEVTWQQASFSASFDGAQSIEPVGLDQAQTLHNYCIGDQSRWRTGVPSYETVAYPGIYEGIDLFTWGRRNSLKYEFHVDPGADYSQIQVSYEGIEGLSLDDEGALHIQTKLGELVDDAPYIYQEIASQRVEVPGEFLLIDQDTYSFHMTGDYDADVELIIDPMLVWSTYLGGSAEDQGMAVAVDGSGNPIVAGDTYSSGWTSGGFDTSQNGDADVFVAKLSATGTHLWSTYLGGSSSDNGYGIAVDSSGNPIVCGTTGSTGWTSGGFDTSHNGSTDAFVAKLSSTGTHLWSTYVGGSKLEFGFGIAVDSSGNPIVTGYTYSSGWASGGFDTSHSGLEDAFVAKLGSTGTHLWSTYLGGSGVDGGLDLVVDSSGNPIVTGYTQSDGWISGGFDTSRNGFTDTFVAKLSATGAHLWSTYLGGESLDKGEGIAIDGSDNVIVVGQTSGASLWTSGGFDTSPNGQGDAYVAQLSPTGSHLWSTFLGGSKSDYALDVAVDGSGDLIVTGYTISDGWTAGGFDTSLNGAWDGFVAQLGSTGTHLWSSYLGGSGWDEGCGIAMDGSGNAIVAGFTESSGWTSGGFDTSHNGIRDAFVAKIATGTSPVNVAPVLGEIGNQQIDEQTELTFTATATDADVPANTLTFSLDAGAPAGAVIDPVSGVFQWTPTEAQGPGDYSITVRVTDDGIPALDDFETITVTVNEVNVAPVLGGIGDQAIDELLELTFTATANDADLPANTLTYSLDAGAPAGASIDPASGVFSWTPTEAQGPGDYSITVRVTDDGTPALDDSETITVTVNEPNVAPVLGIIGNQEIDEQTELAFTVTATDADLSANALTFSLDAGAPAGASIDPGSGVFRWTPSEAQGSGDYSITVRVTDDGTPSLDDFETITVTVHEVNVAPVLGAIGSQEVDELTALTFAVTATDVDLPANALTFSLDAGAPAGASIDPGSGVFRWTPTEAQGPGDYSITLRVTDDGTPALDDSETITVTVHEVPETFTLTAPLSGAYPAGATVIIEWTASGAGPGCTASLCYDEDTTWNGNEHWITGHQVPAADGTGTYDWNTTDVAPGTYFIAGYMYSPTETAVFSHLTQAVQITPGASTPSFDLTGPTTGVYPAGTTVTISWTTAGIVPGSTISLCYDEDTTWWNGNEHWITIDQITAANSTGSYDWNTTGVVPGTYFIAGYIYNAAGATVFSHLTQAVQIDPGASTPSFELTGPTSRTYAAGTSVAISWTASDIVPGSTISLCYDEDMTWWNGNEHWITVDQIAAANGTGSYDWNTTGVVPGTYSIAGYMYNAAGATVFSHLTQAVRIDPGAGVPSFELTGPTSGSYAAGTTVSIGWTAAEVIPGSTISLCYDEDTTWWNGNEHWITVDQVAAADGAGTYDWNTTGVPAGDYFLAGYMYNSAGATIFSHLTQAVQIGPGTSATAFTLTGPTSGGYAAGTSVTISWTAAEVVPGSTISLCYDEDTTWWNGNEHWITVDQIVAANGAGTYDWNTTGVPAGDYFLAGYLYDGTSVFEFSHLMQAIQIEPGVNSPSFQLTGPTSGTFTTGTSVMISWTAANVVSGSTISLCYDEDTTWWNGNEHWITIDQVPAADGTGSYDWDTTNVAAGTCFLAGYLYDGAGGFNFSHLRQGVEIAVAPSGATAPVWEPDTLQDVLSVPPTTAEASPVPIQASAGKDLSVSDLASTLVTQLVQDGLTLQTCESATTTDVEVSAELDVTAREARHAGLVARYTGPGDRDMYLGALVNTQGQYTADIWRNLDGAWTQLVSVPVASGGGTVAFRVSGSLLELSLDGQLLASTIDSAVSRAGSVGIRTFGGTVEALHLATTPALSTAAIDAVLVDVFSPMS